MSVVPESGGQSSSFEDIIGGMTTTSLQPAPMDGDLVYIDSLMGEESRRHLRAICQDITKEMVVRGGELSEKQALHADRRLMKLMDASKLPFAIDQLIAVGGAGAFLAYDVDAEVELDVQVGILTPHRRIFGQFAEVQYNQYPIKEGLLELPEDFEGGIVIDDDEEGYIICLDKVTVCGTSEAGLKIDSFDRAVFPIAENDLLFHTVYRQL